MIEIPAVVRNQAVLLGEERWLASLPDQVRDLEREWQIRVGEVFPSATEALVAAATTDAGERVVVKLAMPSDAPALRNEIAVLERVRGEGCVRLLRSDEQRRALLLERLGRTLFEVGLPLTRRHEVLCDTLERVWRRAPDSGLPTGATKARALIDYIGTTWRELDGPCTEQAVAHAIGCAERRAAAHDEERSFLLHGDAHQWNALESPDGFSLVDPDGLVAEPEYDLGILMREDPVELMRSGDPHERARFLAGRTGLDVVAIWEWGVVERVATGLCCTSIGLQPAGREMLAAADLVAR
jgi:streptomycin 6-kinase